MPPSEAEVARQSQRGAFSHSVGDGGPPPGLDVLAATLLGLGLLSMALWWNSNAPLARVMLLPLLGSVFVVYFFWNGRKWAWVLLMASVMVELSIVLFGFASLRAHLTGPELFALALRVALDVYFLWFSSRPDTASFFERRSGRVGGGR
jgi:hypothetical protein